MLLAHCKFQRADVVESVRFSATEVAVCFCKERERVSSLRSCERCSLPFEQGREAGRIHSLRLGHRSTPQPLGRYRLMF